jgi:hypothetical protein
MKRVACMGVHHAACICWAFGTPRGFVKVYVELWLLPCGPIPSDGFKPRKDVENDCAMVEDRRIPMPPCWSH